MLTMLQRRKPKKRKPNPYNVVQRTSEHKQAEQLAERMTQFATAKSTLTYVVIIASAIYYEHTHETLDWIEEHATPTVTESIKDIIKDIDDSELKFRSFLTKEYKDPKDRDSVITYAALVFHKPHVKQLRIELFNKAKMLGVRCKLKKPYLLGALVNIVLASDHLYAHCDNEKKMFVKKAAKSGVPSRRGYDIIAEETIDANIAPHNLEYTDKLIDKFAALMECSRQDIYDYYKYFGDYLTGYVRAYEQANSIAEMDMINARCHQPHTV